MIKYAIFLIGDYMTEGPNAIQRFINMTKLNSATSRALELLDKLRTLSYFDSTFLDNNLKTLRKATVSNEDGISFFTASQAAVYLSSINSLLLKDELLDMREINEDALTLIILHELIHMASTNLETQVIGYSNSALPVTFNEACTQYLAIKVMFEENMDQGLSTNFIYPESTLKIKALIDEIGEEALYRGFFKAEVINMTNNMDKEAKSKWIDTIFEMFYTNEEKVSTSGVNNFNNTVEEYKEGRL